MEPHGARFRYKLREEFNGKQQTGSVTVTSEQRPPGVDGGKTEAANVQMSSASQEMIEWMKGGDVKVLQVVWPAQDTSASFKRHMTDKVG